MPALLFAITSLGVERSLQPVDHAKPAGHGVERLTPSIGAIRLTQRERSLQPAGHAGGGSCQSDTKPIGVLYNHISKTGGTMMKQVLQMVLGGKLSGQSRILTKDHSLPSAAELAYFPQNGAFIVQDDVQHGLQVTAEDAQHYFIIGLLRRPCDFALSNWAYESDKHVQHKWPRDGLQAPYDTPEDLVKFHDYVAYEATREEQKQSMTAKLASRIPDPSLVHCWARTHSLVQDVKGCMSKFVGCGGNVTFSDWASFGEHHAQMTSDHAPCDHYFNATHMATMKRDEGELMRKYKLGQCCSS